MTQEPRTQENAAKGRRGLGLALFAALLIALFVAARMIDLESGIDRVRGWIEGLGMGGPIAFIGLYIVAVLAMVPGSIPTIMAGGLFGALWGTVYVSIASTIGAALAFLIARYVAGDAVRGWLGGKPWMARVEKMTLHHGAMLVGITRLVPLFPFNLVNYAFGLTKVPFWRYVFVSWLCMLPGTFVYVAGTDAVVQSLTSGETPWLLIGIIVAVVLVLVFLGRRLLRGIAESEAATPQDPS